MCGVLKVRPVRCASEYVARAMMRFEEKSCLDPAAPSVKQDT